MPKPLPILVDDDTTEARAQKKRDRADSVSLSGAQRLLDAGRVDEARAILVELAEEPTTPIRAHACLLAAGVHLMCNSPQSAVDALAKLPAAPTFAVDDGYRKMIEACALRQLRRYDEALVAALASVEQGATAGRLLVLADAQKHAGRVDDAARTLHTLLEREPANATALAQLAGYENLRGDVDAGATWFAKFRALCDADGDAFARDADAHRNAAFYFATKGDAPNAIALLRRAIAIEPEQTRAYIADEIELDRFRTDDELRALTAAG